MEELFKYSDKELHKLLDNKNVYTAKYIIRNDGNSKILRDCSVYNNRLFYRKGINKKITSEYLDYMVKDYRPININDIIELKIDNILKASKKWGYEKFFTYISNKFINHYSINRVDSSFERGKIIIHYPEILIKNSAEQEHLMRDIYLTISVETDYIYLYDLKRTTFTIAEIDRQYTFSHVSGEIYGIGYRNSNFCYGRNNAVNSIMNKMGGGRESMVKNITMFILLIDEYLSWESIEGSPYKYIDRVINDENSLVGVYTPNYNLTEVITTLKNNLTELKYEYILDGYDRYKVKLVDTESIDDILTEHYPTLCFMRDGHSSVNPRNTEKTYSSYQDKNMIEFKGEIKTLNVLPDTNVKEYTLPVKIHHEILMRAVQYLENKFETFLINKKYE